MNSEAWCFDGETQKVNFLSVFFKRSAKGEVLVFFYGFPSSSWGSELIGPSLIERFDAITRVL